MLLLVVRGSRVARSLPVAASVATAALVALGLALGARVGLALLVHFVVAPCLVAPAATRTFLPVQLLVVPAAIFFFSALAVATAEAPVGVLGVLFFALEPGLAAAWIASNPPSDEG